MPILAQMEGSWKSSILSGAGLSYYGHRDDIGTPAWRLGGTAARVAVEFPSGA